MPAICGRYAWVAVLCADAVAPEQALLVLSDAEAAAEVAAEVRQLEQDARPGATQAPDLCSIAHPS